MEAGRRNDLGPALIAELKRKGLNASPVKPTVSKEARASVEAAKFESGRVYFPNKAPWLDDLEAELFAFPAAKHDDQVDSMVHALAYDRPRTITKVTLVKGYGYG